MKDKKEHKISGVIDENYLIYNIQIYDDDTILYLRNGSDGKENTNIYPKMMKMDLLPEKETELYHYVSTYTIYKGIIYILHNDGQLVCRYNDNILLKCSFTKLNNPNPLMNVDDKYILCLHHAGKDFSTVSYMNNKMTNEETTSELNIPKKDGHSISKIVGIMSKGTYYYIMMSRQSLYLYKRGDSNIEYVYDVTDRDASYRILTIYKDSIIVSNKRAIYDLSINI